MGRFEHRQTHEVIATAEGQNCFSSETAWEILLTRYFPRYFPGRLLPETEKQNAEIYDRLMAESQSHPPRVGRKRGNKGDAPNRSPKAKGVGGKGRKKGGGRR